MEELQPLCEREFNTAETMRVLQSPINIFWCWGVSQAVNLHDKGLLLKVNGHLHNGLVLIILAWNDTYTVYLLSKKFEVKSKHTEIYFDMLQDTFDRLVETKSN